MNDVAVGHSWVMGVSSVFHFSEDPSIEVFRPHVPATNPSEPAAVWAIDAEHAPLYWFPRDCPRATAWPRPGDSDAAFHETFATDAPRVHVAELGWLERIRDCTLHRYEFDAAPFEPWVEATGQWTAFMEVEPIRVEPVGDLLQQHVDAGIELRFVPNLWQVADLAVDERWDFSLVRMKNALPRPGSASSVVERPQ